MSIINVSIEGSRCKFSHITLEEFIIKFGLKRGDELAIPQFFNIILLEKIVSEILKKKYKELTVIETYETYACWHMQIKL